MPNKTGETGGETGKKVKRDKGKFIGAYIPRELSALLSEDAKSESRTVSKHITHLILLGLYARGHDITTFFEIGTHNRDFLALKEHVDKENKSKSKAKAKS